jgi:hypothetical protein
MAAAATAQTGGPEDWKSQLQLPPKDSRYKTEVRRASTQGRASASLGQTWPLPVAQESAWHGALALGLYQCSITQGWLAMLISGVAHRVS